MLEIHDEYLQKPVNECVACKWTLRSIQVGSSYSFAEVYTWMVSHPWRNQDKNIQLRTATEVIIISGDGYIQAVIKKKNKKIRFVSSVGLFLPKGGKINVMEQALLLTSHGIFTTG